MVDENKSEQSTNESDELNKSQDEKTTDEKLYDKEEGNTDDKKSENKSDSEEKESKEDDSKKEDKAKDSKDKDSKEGKEVKETKETKEIKEIKLDLPKDSLISEERVEEIVSYAKEQGFSNEQAQEMVNRENDAVLEYKEGEQVRLDGLVETEWPKQIQKDKELGGDNFKKNCELAKRALEKTASPALKKMLNKSGLGSNPEVVRHFYRLGKIMQEDEFIFSGVQNKPKKLTPAQKLYGET